MLKTKEKERKHDLKNNENIKKKTKKKQRKNKQKTKKKQRKNKEKTKKKQRKNKEKTKKRQRKDKEKTKIARLALNVYLVCFWSRVSFVVQMFAFCCPNVCLLFVLFCLLFVSALAFVCLRP